MYYDETCSGTEDYLDLCEEVCARAIVPSIKKTETATAAN
jgi:hypothetical protein